MSNDFQTYLKGLKLKKIVVELKTAQLVKLDEESIDLFKSTGRMVQKSSLSSRTLVQSVDNLLRGGRGPTVTNHVLNANG